MTELKESRILQQAIEAAADLVVEAPIGLPPLPSSTSLCRALGVGASTFHRLFGNTESFHQAFIEWHLDEVYQAGADAAVEAMAAGASSDLPEMPVDFGFQAAVGLAGLYWADLGHTPLPEAKLYPWLTNEPIRTPVVRNTAAAIEAESQVLSGFLVTLGADRDQAKRIAAQIFDWIVASDIAIQLVANGNGLTWPVPELTNDVSLIELSIGRTAAAVIESFQAGHLENGAVDDTAQE